jgi:hypothetical protein
MFSACACAIVTNLPVRSNCIATCGPTVNVLSLALGEVDRTDLFQSLQRASPRGGSWSKCPSRPTALVEQVTRSGHRLLCLRQPFQARVSHVPRTPTLNSKGTEGLAVCARPEWRRPCHRRTPSLTETPAALFRESIVDDGLGQDSNCAHRSTDRLKAASDGHLPDAPVPRRPDPVIHRDPENGLLSPPIGRRQPLHSSQ